MPTVAYNLLRHKRLKIIVGETNYSRLNLFSREQCIKLHYNSYTIILPIKKLRVAWVLVAILF